MIIRVYGEIIMIQLPQINWQIASFIIIIIITMTVGRVFRADKTYPLCSLSLPSETLSNLN